MSLSKSAALLVAAVTVFAVAGCSGGNAVSTQPQTSAQQPVQPAPIAVQTQVLTLSPSASSYSLKLPAGYSGTLTLGSNHAPAGTKLEVGVSGGLLSSGPGEKMLTGSRHTDPFPIVFSIRLPITLTLPIPGFSITFPSWVNLAQGTFDVSLFDPTQPISYIAPGNPTLLGKATASGQTLTFVPAVQFFTFQAGVKYSDTIARDTGGAGVVLPLAAGFNTQALPPNGTLGGPNVNANSTSSTFVQWTVIPFGPTIPFGASSGQGVESLVVQSTAATTLGGTTVTMSFNPGGPSPAPGGPNTFVPDPTPTVLGPYPATFNSETGTWSFSVTNPVPLVVGKKFAFSLLTVKVCAPANVFAPCDFNNPSNALTQLNPNQQYDVLVSDLSGLLTGSYSVAVTGSNPDGTPLTSGTACSFVSEAGDNGDHPAVYNDSWPQGPNTEFEVNTGSPPEGGAACTFVVSYNGNIVALENLGIGTTLSPMMKTRIMHRMFVRPPVNGPHGVVISGSGG